MAKIGIFLTKNETVSKIIFLQPNLFKRKIILYYSNYEKNNFIL